MEPCCCVEGLEVGVRIRVIGRVQTAQNWTNFARGEPRKTKDFGAKHTAHGAACVKEVLSP
jgi:hypothetical protein